MMSAARTELETRLAGLIGMSIGDDDRSYVAEILDSLLEMGDSPDDVVEYLGSFVASSADDDGGGGGDEDCDDELRRFSLDVSRFKLLGEGFDDDDGMIATTATAAAATTTTTTATIDGKPKKRRTRRILDEAAAEREAIKRREAEARERQREERDMAAKIKKKEMDEKERLRIATMVSSSEAQASTAARNNKQSEGSHYWGDEKKNTGNNARQVPDGNSRSLVSKSDAKETAISKEAENQDAGKQRAEMQRAEEQRRAEMRKTRPERGTPGGEICGCYGIRHRPLANCLHCGRIACELEGIDDYCHFCGYFVDEFRPRVDATGGGDANRDAKMASAMRHKERLLEFDRTSAARTRIHDDQEDYFSAATSMWSTEQEREDNLAMEDSRQQKVHERKKNVLQIKF